MAIRLTPADFLARLGTGVRLAIAVIPKFAAGHLARLHPYVIVKPPRATSAARRGEGRKIKPK